MTATFRAYQGANREQLISRLVDCKDWSHIGQVRASEVLNHVEVDVFFRKRTVRAEKACKQAAVLSLWTIAKMA